MEGEDTLRDFLLEAGLVSRGQLEEALRQAQGGQLSHALVAHGVLSEDEIRRAMSHAYGVPFVTLTRHDLLQEALELIPEPLSRAHNAVAFNLTEKGLEVAVLDLKSLEALEPLRLGHKHKILPRFTTRESIKQALLHYQHLLKDKFAHLLLTHREPSKIVAHLLSHAILQGASALHLEPAGGGTRVRERVGGTLEDAMHLPAHVGEAVGRALPKEGRVSI